MDGVEGRTMLHDVRSGDCSASGRVYFGKSDRLRVDGRSAGRVRTIRSVAHGSIEGRPYWSKDVARRVQRGLLERSVCGLRDAC